MSTIRILPETLSNKIAAGEVVERPASIVKELLENAIDAGSSRIMVQVEQGGRRLIRVSDNGHGMDRDDALLSLERYATSKIRKDPDLFAIKTLGFRGEALPSIASVSHFTLVTRATGMDTGTRIEVWGGKIKSVSQVGAPVGTMITVERLFYNTPARRKFLKSIATETGHIADTLSSMALCRPSVQLRLSHNNRNVKNWAPATSPPDRVADVLGASVKNDLYPVKQATKEVTIDGWVAAARLTRTTARGIYLFVNGRWVKDRVIQHALYTAYRGRLMKGRYPVAVLFLDVPFDQVDVNVHPTKHEIRFVRQKAVHDTLRDAVTAALKQSDPPRWSVPGPGAQPNAQKHRQVAELQSNFEDPATIANLQVETDGQRPGRRQPGKTKRASTAATASASLAGDTKQLYPCGQEAQRKASSAQTPLWKPRFFADLVVIGQYRGTYLICESTEGLIVIDQHAAHERIVFEQLKHRSAEHRPNIQQLLLPETVDLRFSEARVLEDVLPELNRYGMEIEPFGGNSFVVKSIPSVLDSGKIRVILAQIVEKAADMGVKADTETLMDECLMIMACHNAVRAHQKLTDRQIRSMLEQLDGCENPSHCPHGRPTWIQWTEKDLEKRFRRIV